MRTASALALTLFAAAILAPRPVLAEKDDGDARRIEKERELCRREAQRDRHGRARGTRENGRGHDWHERCRALLAPPPPLPAPPPAVLPPPMPATMPAPMPSSQPAP